MTEGTRSTDVAVIGAGPYGLAVASHLLANGVTTRVFGIPMLAWTEHMPKGMFLKSAFDATDISAPQPGSTLIDFCHEIGVSAYDDWHPIPVDVFSNYGLHFQKRYVGIVERTIVTSVTPAHGGFRIALADGETFSARKVVVASGHLSFAHTPPSLLVPGAGNPKLVSHSCEHRDLAVFAGKEVAVVGAGQSALESAVLLDEAGAKVHLLVRDPALHWGGPPVSSDTLFRRIFKPRTPYGPGWSHVFITEAPSFIRHLPVQVRLALVGRTYGPSGAWWLKPRFGKSIRTWLSTTVEGVRESGGRAALQLRSESGGASSLAVDHLIAGTGYKIDIDKIVFLDPSIRLKLARAGNSGSPRLSARFESSVPGLYFVGLTAAATFGPLLRFVHGTKFAATTVCKAIVPARGGAVPLKAKEAAASR
jgi:cation diffusion facilitator CzcD-associated flavoprotein CzcO